MCAGRCRLGVLHHQHHHGSIGAKLTRSRNDVRCCRDPQAQCRAVSLIEVMSAKRSLSGPVPRLGLVQFWGLKRNPCAQGTPSWCLLPCSGCCSRFWIGICQGTMDADTRGRRRTAVDTSASRHRTKADQHRARPTCSCNIIDPVPAGFFICSRHDRLGQGGTRVACVVSKLYTKGRAPLRAGMAWVAGGASNFALVGRRGWF